MTRLTVLCDRRELDDLVDTFSDWKAEGAEILLYGATEKANDGFILMQWSKPIPQGFIQRQLQEDESVLDFFTDDAPNQSQRVPA
jgi:hypothetical protein